MPGAVGERISDLDYRLHAERVAVRIQAKLYLSSDARRSERREVDAVSTLRTRGDCPFDVQVTDVSTHGFACLTTADIRQGDAVTIGLQGIAEGAAIVRWRRGAFIGCEFERPMTQGDADALFSRIVVVPRSFAAPSVDKTPPSLIDVTGLTERQFVAAVLALGMLLALVNDWLAGGY